MLFNSEFIIINRSCVLVTEVKVNKLYKVLGFKKIGKNGLY